MQEVGPATSRRKCKCKEVGRRMALEMEERRWRLAADAPYITTGEKGFFEWLNIIDGVLCLLHSLISSS